jgi:hypothetical protein
VSDDIHAERRIHQLEEQLRNARDDALEEAARYFEKLGMTRVCGAASAVLIREMKGTQA